MHDYKSAEIYGLRSLENTQKIGLANISVKNYESLAKIYYANGDFKKTFEYQELFSSLKDSIFTRESQKKLAEFQAIHETEEKEYEIKLLNSTNLIQEVYIRKAEQRFYFLIAITVLLMVVIGLVYYQYYNRKKINKLLAEKNRQLQLLNSTKDRFISILRMT